MVSLKKVTPKSQAKIKPSFLQHPFLTISNPTKVSCEQIYDLITFMRLYSNVYDCTIYTLNCCEEYYEDKCLAGY